MGSSNPLKSLVKGVGSFFGQKTDAERAAENAQKAALAEAKSTADKQLKEREERMKRKRTGRSSLLSGTELGVEEKPMQSTLG